MKKMLLALGMAACGLSVQAQNYNLALAGVEEIDSLSNATHVGLAVRVKNNGDMFPYMVLRVVLDSAVVGDKDGYLNSYGTLTGQEERFSVLVPRPKKENKQQKYTLLVESHETTMTQKFEFEYQPKAYKAPKKKKEKAKKVEAPVINKAEVKSTPPMPPK